MMSLTKRSKTFQEVIGHKKIIKEFQKRIKEKEIPQCILLYGISGQGKTTLAFLIAKILNCKNPIKKENIEPCNECDSCKNINDEIFNRDIKFIDCSKYSKGDISDLSESLNINTLYDDNKIYILDEFHCLSSAAKSATLKLIEKPRKNVYFIACTMEVQKIHKSIRDRFQEYYLAPLLIDEIYDHLFNLVLDNDEIPESFIKEVLPILSYNAKGSMRAAIQSLERCLFGELYTKELVEKELNFISEEKLLNIIYYILNKSKEGLEELLNLEDIESFYNYSKVILVEANIYKILGYCKEKWKEYNAKKISNYNTLIPLLDIYFNSINNYGYVDKSLFLYNLISKYYSNNIQKTIKRKAVNE